MRLGRQSISWVAIYAIALHAILWGVAPMAAAALPDARLEVLPPGGILIRHRRAIRDLIGGFLSGEECEGDHV